MRYRAGPVVLEGLWLLCPEGLTGGHDRTVLRGDPASGRFSVFYYRSDTLLGVESLNRPADHLAVRKILTGKVPLTADEAADESVDLKSYAGQAVHAVGGTVT